MARIKGQVKFTGRLGDLSAYMTQDGLVLRARTGPDKKRLKNDKAYRAVYNQSIEFGACAKAAKLLRRSLQSLIYKTCDNRLSSRLNKVMNEIKNLDVVSEPGKRLVGKGIKDQKATNFLTDFNLNIHANLRQIITTPYYLDTQKQVMNFGKIYLKKALKGPKSATEVTVSAAHAVIDFEKEDFYTVEDFVTMPLNAGADTLTLDLKNNWGLEGLHVYVLKISFWQEVNGVKYELEEAKWKGCEIVGACWAGVESDE